MADFKKERCKSPFNCQNDMAKKITFLEYNGIRIHLVENNEFIATLATQKTVRCRTVFVSKR